MKYIIEIEDEPLWRQSALHGMNTLFKAKNFNALVFDKEGLNKLTPLDTALEEAYQRGLEDGKKQAKAQAELDVCHDIEKVAREHFQKGLNDAWECAKKALHYNDYQREVVFGEDNFYKIMEEHSASEALAKLKAYEQQKDEIKVGDEVRNTLGTMDNAIGYFFGDSSDGCYKVLRYVDGKFKTGIWNKENCERTGKHSDAVERMVAVMKAGAE